MKLTPYFIAFSIAVVLLLGGCVPTQITGPVEGRVTDKTTGLPIGNATITYNAAGRTYKTKTTKSDNDGKFSLSGINFWTPPLPFLACCSEKTDAALRIHAQGYLPDGITDDDTPIPEKIDIELTPLEKLSPKQVVTYFYGQYFSYSSALFQKPEHSDIYGLLMPALLEQQKALADKERDSTYVDYFFKVTRWDNDWHRVNVISEKVEGDSALLIVEIGRWVDYRNTRINNQFVEKPIETLAVALQLHEQRWKISSVTLVSAKDPCNAKNDTLPKTTVRQSPQEAAEAFYHWYIPKSLSHASPEHSDEIAHYVTDNFLEQFHRIRLLGDYNSYYFTQSNEMLNVWHYFKSKLINQAPGKAQVLIELGDPDIPIWNWKDQPSQRLKVTLAPTRKRGKYAR